MVFPGWLATTEQIPVPSSVMVLKVTEQTGWVVDVKLSGRPDVAVATRVMDALPKAVAERDPKLMVWVPGVIVKDWLTGLAAA